MQELANTIHELITRLHIEKPILVGQSFGGGIAATYATLFPEDTKYLILVDAATTKSERYRPFLARIGMIFGIPIYRSILRNQFIPLSFKRLLVHLLHRAPLEILSAEKIQHYGNFVSKRLYDISVDYKKFRMPLMLVWGDRDKITPIQAAREIHEEVKNSKLVIVNGQHTILYTQPEYVVSEIVKKL